MEIRKVNVHPKRRRALFAVLVLCCGGLPAHAQQADLGQLTLEELMKVEITSASRKQQSLASIPAAVHVITADDIRRSGFTALPEVLRLAPGVQVARMNTSKWAVSIRGFNGLYSTKLLVLVDGRAVYSRFYSGVLWDAEEVSLEEIERIEIIRGPVGAMWGTNAVNGVINIVTRSASAAAGTVVHASVGSFDRGFIAASHAGAAGASRYRLFSRWISRGDTRLPDQPVDDDSSSWRTGARFERERGPMALLLDAQVGGGWHKPLWLTAALTSAPTLIGGTTQLDDGALLARLTRKMKGDGALQLQGSLEASSRDEPIGRYTHRAADLDIQVHRPGKAHDLVVGAAHRLLRESLDGALEVRLDPPIARESIFSAFLQDDLRLGSAVVATVGARLEKVTSLNWQVQPTARVMWSPGERQHVWGAVSRGVRTPSLQERRIRIAFPPVDMGLGLPLATQIAGNPDMRPETVVSVEAGYRVSAARLEVDASVFRSRYADLRSMEAGPPEVHVGPDGPFLLAVSRFDNLFAADSTGAEMLGRLRLRPGWRAEAGVTLFHLRPRLHSSSRDTVLVDYDGGAPKLQMFLRNSFMTGPNDFDLFLSMVGRLVKTGVPAYGRLDLRWERRLSAAVSLAAVGQNLLQADHFEGDRADVMQLPTSLPRSVNLQLRWRIR